MTAIELLKSAARRAGLRRARVASIRLWTERRVLAFRPAGPPRPGGRILCYHGVGTPSWGVNDVSPARLRRHLELAATLGYRWVPAAQIARGEGGPKDLAITFDDGLRSVAEHGAPILASFGVPWSMFVVTDWADGHGLDEDVAMRWDELCELAATPGVEIGSHSATHRRLSDLPEGELRRELTESRRLLSEHLGRDVTSFAVPFGQHRDWSEDCQALALEVGYTEVYAQAEQTRTAGTVPRTFVTAYDDDRTFRAALAGAFDRWEEWY